jgi:parallel beta-helix repeat protein
MKHLLLSVIFISLNAIGQITFDPVPSYFRVSRDLPLVELNPTQTIFLSSYGAVPNDGLDDKQAIINAINAANSASNLNNKVKLLFDTGVYDIFPATGPNHAMVLSNLDYIVIDGNNAEIINHNPEIGVFQFHNCTSVIIQNLKIDYNKLPFTQGSVTAVNKTNKTFDFTIDTGFPSLSESYFANASEKWGMLKISTGKLKGGVDYLFNETSVTQISASVFRLKYATSTEINQFKVGDKFVKLARNNNRTVFYISNSKNLTLLNTVIYASPAVAISSYNNYEWNIINCSIVPKSGRIQSTNADCIHSSGNYLGPWVQGCTFETQSDDGVNLKYMNREILSITSPTLIKIKWDVSVGDSLVFYEPLSGTILGEAGVAAVTNSGNGEYNVILNSGVNLTTTGSHQSANKLYIKNKSNESFIFRNNTFSKGRRFGIQVQAPYGVIENCTFQDLSNSALHIENGVDWSEGYFTKNLKVLNNTITNCGFDLLYCSNTLAGAITTRVAKLGTPCNTSVTWCGTETATVQGQLNVEISGNNISYNKCGLHLQNVNGLTLKDNIISRNSGDITTGTPVPVYINNCNQDLSQALIDFPMNEGANATSLVNFIQGSTIYADKNCWSATMNSAYQDTSRGNVWYIDSNYGGFFHVKKDNNVNYPGATGTTSRTYSLWFKPDLLQFNDLLYSGTSPDIFTIQMESGGVIRVGDNTNWVRMTGLMPLVNQWNHLVVSVPANSGVHNVKLYLNGQLSTATNTGINATIITASNLLKLYQKFKGYVSDFRFYNYALIDQQVSNLYSSTLNNSPYRVTTITTDITSPNETGITVYPIQTKGMIYFNHSIRSLKIYDLTGSIVSHTEGLEIDAYNISSLKSGIYLLKVNNNQIVRIVKQ